MGEPPGTSSTTKGRLRLATIAAGPALCAAVVMLLNAVAPDLAPEARRTAGVMAWMALWWVTEAIPLPATSLLPLVLLPALEITTGREAANPYASRVIFLFLGGFLLALSMERWSLHKRIALVTISIVGSSPAMIVAGFMLATAVLSMWMSNTATAIMLVPIGTTVIALVNERFGDDSRSRNFGVCLMLGIAYAASIGGIATPIGTPPNTLLVAFLDSEFGLRISFFRWMMFGLPIVAVFLPIAWLLLTRVLYPVGREAGSGGREMIRSELAKLGPTSRAEWTVMTVFVCAVLLWFGRGVLNSFVGDDAPWAIRLLVDHLDDTSIAIGAALVLFLTPIDLGKRQFALDWDDAARVPWGILLLFGGGLSLAGAVSGSGLSAAIGNSLDGLQTLPILVIILLVVATIVYLTEVTSNTATANIFFPLLAPIAILSIEMNPLGLLAPAALAASCAFMMPVATPPNAIVFASGNVRMKHMLSAGFWMNIVSVLTLTLCAYTLMTWVLGMDLGTVPEWAQPEAAQP